MRVIVAGCGIVGAACAAFLARYGVAVTVVERRAPACAASGKAGGFLARDWCDGLPRGPLARRGFALHRELARSRGTALGYRSVETLLVRPADEGERTARGAESPGPGFAVVATLGGPQTTALVDPARLTRHLLETALLAGARLRIAAVEAVLEDAKGGVCGVRLAGGERLEADAVILAQGPWSRSVEGLAGVPPVAALLGHSLAFTLPEPLPPRVLFVTLERGRFGLDEIEVYPRADGTVIVAGASRPARPPADPAEVGPDPGAPQRLLEAARAVLPVLAGARTVEARACLRPVSADGTPLLGPVPGRPGLWLATGHGPWGILEGPASGELLADLLTGRAPAVDPRPFDPARPAADPAGFSRPARGSPPRSS